MTVRAKFRCHSITLTRAQAPNPEVLAKLPHTGGYNYGELNAKAEEMGLEPMVGFDQPTVKLGAVTGGADKTNEDRAFWSATPAGSIEITISNPDAAETFELGEHYYVDFSPAP